MTSIISPINFIKYNAIWLVISENGPENHEKTQGESHDKATQHKTTQDKIRHTKTRQRKTIPGNTK